MPAIKSELTTAVRSDLKTRREAAAYLRVAEQTLALWASNKRYNLPFVKVGRRCLYRQADLDAWLESRTVRTESTEE